MKFSAKKWIVPILAVMLALSVAAGLYQTNRLRDKLGNAIRNIEALNDTVRELELKNGELVEWGNALVVDKNTIRESLEEESLSKKEIERTLGAKIDRLSKIISEFDHDTITVTDTVEVIRDGEFTAPFRYSDDWLTVSGKTLFDLETLTSETTISTVSVRVPLTIGLTDDNQVFVHSKNPHISIETMNSMYLEQKTYNQRRIGIGLYAGFGMQYSMFGRKVDFGPQIGIGLYWRLF